LCFAAVSWRFGARRRSGATVAGVLGGQYLRERLLHGFFVPPTSGANPHMQAIPIGTQRSRFVARASDARRCRRLRVACNHIDCTRRSACAAQTPLRIDHMAYRRPAARAPSATLGQWLSESWGLTFMATTQNSQHLSHPNILTTLHQMPTHAANQCPKFVRTHGAHRIS
jgi:hypothetical protein